MAANNRHPQGGQDLEYADTVVVAAIEDPRLALAPRPIIFNDETGTAHHIRPLSFPPPKDEAREGVDANLVQAARLKVRAAVETVRAPWDETLSVVSNEDRRARRFGRRLRALVSLWRWEQADVLRAAAIGVTVLALSVLASIIVLR